MRLGTKAAAPYLGRVGAGSGVGVGVGVRLGLGLGPGSRLALGRAVPAESCDEVEEGCRGLDRLCVLLVADAPG